MKKVFLLGLATGLTIAGASLVLANSQIQAILNDQIKVTLNGQVQEFKDETTNETQYPITYHDRTYLPLRTVANLVGVDVDYDANSNTALLKKDETVISKIEALAKNKLKNHIILLGEGSSTEEYHADDVEITKIDVYTDEYLKLKSKQVNSLSDEEKNYDDAMFLHAYETLKQDNYDYAGYITFVLHYDNDITNGWWAGSGPAATEGNYALGSYIFTVKGNEISFGTGW